jgi:3-mercaptopyruvate sulfurtransferase SseA
MLPPSGPVRRRDTAVLQNVVMDTTLITAPDLAAALDGEHPPAVLDVRWQLAGHIPGATSAPTLDNLQPDGRFRPVRELAERFAALGVEPGTQVGVYCGSGVTAAHELLALHLAGIDGALYPGSWSEWSGLPDRPVATGPQRG